MIDISLKDLNGSKKVQRRKGSIYRSDMVAAYRASGLSQSGFCRDRGISYSTFKNWVSRAREDSIRKDENADGFIPVLVSSKSSEMGEHRSSFSERAGICEGGDLRVCLPWMQGVLSIFVPRGFDELTLKRLMGVVGGMHV